MAWRSRESAFSLGLDAVATAVYGNPHLHHSCGREMGRQAIQFYGVAHSFLKEVVFTRTYSVGHKRHTNN